MQNHIHDRDDVCERLFFLALESALLKNSVLSCGALWVGLPQIIKRLAKKSRRADRTIVDALSDLGLHDLHNGADERTRGVIFTTIAPGISHIPDLRFIKMRKLVL